MFQTSLFKLLLAPFALLYGVGVNVRNFLYKTQLLKSVRFDIPVISVGNLSVGGAGKTPHIEYLIRLLKDYLNVATLSRGYNRQTQGFLPVEGSHNATQVGDEPLQFKRKYPDVFVTVAENRAFAIPQILGLQPATQTVLLDDAFQHRAVAPGLNILLTEYAHPYTKDYLLPVGRLREWGSSAKRAHIIVVTKCPPQLSLEQRAVFLNDLKPETAQHVYFSYYQYNYIPYYLFNAQYGAPLDYKLDVLLVCAIARTDYLVEHLKSQVNSVRILEYADHHFFTKSDLGQIKANFDAIESTNKIILTTEKDAMRLELHRDFLIQNQLPLFVLPIQVAFHFEEGAQFDGAIKQFLLNFKA
jgi:tetraacyldisaccharide 4'-kinase